MMIMHRGRFNPNSYSRDDMKALAMVIENYLDALDDVIVIPEDVQKEHGDEIAAARRECRKLIKKLRAGDTSVFNDPEDWDSYIIE